MSLPLSTHYRLENVTFNNLAVLWDREFSPEDLTKMDTNPELLVRWGLGQDVGFSIGAKKPEDKVYICSEGGEALYEIEYQESAELVTSFSKLVYDTGNEISRTITEPNMVRFSMDDAETSNIRPYIKFNCDVFADKMYQVNVQVIKHSGVMECSYMIVNGGTVVNKFFDINLTNSGIVNRAYSFFSDNDAIVIYYNQNGKAVDNTITVSIKEVLSGYLTIQGTYTRIKNQQYGVQTLGLKLNEAGVPTALVPAGTLSFKNNTTAYTDTQWKPKLDTYTIRQVVEGELEDLDASGVATGSKTFREEQRLITHDITGTDKIYINGELQPYTPALPDPTKTIKITDTAIIGYPDKIDLAKTKCEAWSKVLTQEEIDAL